MKTIFNVLSLLFFISLSTSSLAQEIKGETFLLRAPSASDTHICFAYAGDIWVADRNGKNPHRLTVHAGDESTPYISPDGKRIAFTGEYDGNVDVYVVSTSGGAPQRMTFHSGPDQVRGWDGNEKILFTSSRESNSNRYTKVFSVNLTGGYPTALKMPEAHQASVSPDSKYTAYIKNPDPTEARGAYRPFKLYRGGNMPKIWIFDNTSYEITEIPTANSNNMDPVWVGKNVYFLSDRNGVVNLFEYNTQSKKIEQLTRYTDFDVKTLTANGNTLALEQGGRIHLFDAATRQGAIVPIILQVDLPARRPHYVEANDHVGYMEVSPTGVRGLMEIRGDIFTIPTEKGNPRNITNTPGVFERSPEWSPDGKWIAYFSDADGEYKLHLIDQLGQKEPTIINLPTKNFYYTPYWSPDSKKILFSDKQLNLHLCDIATKKVSTIDQNNFVDPSTTFAPSWSPDNRWIAYQKRLDNFLNAIFIYDTKTGTKKQVTDGMSEAGEPSFSRDGKYLFFMASTNFGLNASWLDMTNYERPIRSSIYAIVLAKDEPSLLVPESDEEEVAEEEESSDKEEDKEDESTEEDEMETTIDFDGIEDRIVALPLPPRNYGSLNASVEGKLFYAEYAQNQPGATLHSYDIGDRESKPFLSGFGIYTISADGKKMIYSANGSFGIVGTGSPAKVGEGSLSLNGVKVYVDPVAEWRQMFHEVWRIQRDWLYVENMHGANWEQAKARYEAFLPHVGSRDDFNYLLAEMMSEVVIGHNYVGAGDLPDIDRVNVGLLGADFEIQNGKYKIARILDGLNWNPNFRSPLTGPGINIKEGMYIQSINGQALNSQTNIFALLQNTARKQTRLMVSKTASGENAEEVIVLPTGDETSLRLLSWVEDNRRKVDEMTDGRVAYVYMPNTGGGGYTFFNRYYFSQLDKEAVIIDERFNGGGSAADYVIDLLDREIMNYWGPREGKVFTTPGAAIFGPKAMIIDEYAASGGDLMPFLFKEKNLGKLIGKRTLGILVGIYGYPSLIDGGFATAPRFGIFSKEGKWIIENEGVSPDIEVDRIPKEMIAGKDPQLEKAVEVILEELKAKPKQEIKIPKAPVRAKQ